MLKNTLLAAGAAIAIIASASVPASAVPTCPVGVKGVPGCDDPKPVPEPVTVLGSLAVGGGWVAKKFADSRKASK